MTTHLPVSQLSALAILSMAASLTAQSLLPTKGQIIAQPGDTAIGLATGEVFGGTSPFDTPVMSANGLTLFRGTLTGGSIGTFDNRALFVGHTHADLKVLVRTNQIDPSNTFPNSVLVQLSSGTGMPLSSNLFSNQRISPNGTFMMFPAQLYDGGNPGADGLNHAQTGVTIPANDTVMYWVTGTSFLILARQNITTMAGGAVLSSAMGGAFSQQATALNSAGTAMFKSDLAGGDVVGTDNNTAWVIGGPNNLQYFLREGDAVLGGANVVGANLLGFNCALNEGGLVLHDERLSLTLGTSPATTADDSVLFITDTSTGAPYTHNLVMREGSPAPDAAGVPMAGITYGAPTISQGFSAAGNCAFHSTLTGTPGGTADDGALFIGGIGGSFLVAQDGMVVPGTGGEALTVINTTSGYSDAGGVVFGGSLVAPGVGGVTATNDSVLCVAKIGQPLQLIAREGDACPGFPGYVFGNITGSSNFGSASSHRNNELGQIMFAMTVNDGTNQPTALCSWDPVHGLQLQLIAHNTLGDTMGGGTVSNVPTPLQFPSGDGNTLGFTGTGDFVIKPGITAPSGSFVARGHIGSMHSIPSAMDSVTGGTVNFSIDATPAHAFSVYVILGTTSGTNPGFPSPLGPQNIPLNFDFWTQLSLDLANSGVYTNSLWFTDAQGVGMVPASFNLPGGVAGVQGLQLHHAAVLLDFNTLASTFVTEPSGITIF